jgi:uncharacterized membrane protein YgcG
VFWTVNGTAPNRELVIEWRNMSHFGCKTDGTETVTFEAVLFENTTDVLFNYAKTAFGGDCTASDNGGTTAIGIQSTSKVAQQFSFDAPKLSSNTALSWKSTLPGNVVPTLATVYPTSWATDIYDLFVELTGTHFSYNAVVLVNGVPAATYVFSSTDLFFDLPPSAMSKVGTLQLAVFNGSPGGGPSNPISLPIKSDDFSLSTSTDGVRVKAGQAANATIWAYPNPAFQAGVNLSCSGLPANLSCNFNPGSILTSSYSVVTFTAKPLSSSSTSLNASLALCFPVGGLLWIGILQAAPRGHRRRAKSLLSLLILGLLLGCGGSGGPQSTSSSSTAGSGSTGTGGSGGSSGSGSGGGSTSGSGTGPYTVTITGTSGSVQHSVTISVTVTT